MTIYKLGEICSYVEGYVNPSINNKENFCEPSKGLNWLKVSELKHGQVITESSFAISKKVENAIKNKNQIFKSGSIVWSKSGTVGLTSILGMDATANRGILNIVPNLDYVYNKYLFYLLLKNKDKFSNRSTGAVLQHFYGPNLMSESFDIPSIEKQRKIIDIIEPIEKLIQKNKEILKSILNLVTELEFKSRKFIFSEHIKLISNKPKGIEQVSAKALTKRGVILTSYEKEATYKTNTYFVEKGTLLINTIRTYLEKFAITDKDLDANGTLAQFKIDDKFFTTIIKNILHNDFWAEMNMLSQGTKMPVIKKGDILSYVGKYSCIELDGLKEIIILNSIFEKS